MDYRIKDLPKSERPRHKMEEIDTNALTNVELLSLILRTGISGKNVKELSAEILNTYSLSKLADRSLEELMSFKGVSEVKAGQLKALGELSRRMRKKDKEKITSLSDVKARVEDMRFMEKEILRILILSSGNKLLKEEEIKGGIDSVRFSTREILEPAISQKGAAIILAHNHPSGESSPTEKDLETTREIMDAADSLGIDLLDHVIVGEEVVSMKSDGYIRH